MDVVLLRWPAEALRRTDLARQGRPRLLLIEGEVRPPDASDCLEDWIRMPASDADLKTRLAGLKERADRHGSRIPFLDEDGVLRHGSCWVPLPPVESRLTGALLERYGAVVSREYLAQAGWPEGPPGRNALDVHVLRLRRRINPLGLVIRTIRSRGYLLEGQVAA